jgi:hypothetical protein
MFLGVKETDYWFHQTLTVKENVIDERTSRHDLKKLLDSLGKVFPNMGCFWVREYQDRGAIHFHAIFLLFGQQEDPPDVVCRKFGAEVFSRWNAIHDGKLNRQANEIRLRRKDFDCFRYLVGGLLPVRNHRLRELHWYGLHQRELIESNPVPRKLVQDYYERAFPKPTKDKGQLPKVRCSKADVDGLKAHLKAHGKWDWRSFKKSYGKGNLSDIEFCTYLNSMKLSAE